MVCVLAVMVALCRCGFTETQASAQFAWEGRPPPILLPGRCILAVYVDNCNIIAWCREDAERLRSNLCVIPDEWKLGYRIEFDGVPRCPMVGLVVSAREATLCNRSWRVRRLRAAILDFIEYCY